MKLYSFAPATNAQRVLMFVAEKEIDLSIVEVNVREGVLFEPSCLLYTSPSPRDGLLSRMPSSA